MQSIVLLLFNPCIGTPLELYLEKALLNGTTAVEVLHCLIKIFRICYLWGASFSFRKTSTIGCHCIVHTVILVFSPDAEEVYVHDVTQEVMFSGPACIAAHLPQGLQHLQESVSFASQLHVHQWLIQPVSIRFSLSLIPSCIFQ